jgi:hypothetical protein
MGLGGYNKVLKNVIFSAVIVMTFKLQELGSLYV